MPGQRTTARTPQLGRFEFGIAKRKARQIVGRAGFTRQDREDLEQELLIRLLQGLRSFNPRVAHRKAFVTAIVERAVASILRDARAEKRDHRRVCSLHQAADEGDDGPTELADLVGEREYNRRRCRDPRSRGELTELANDLADVTAALPDDLRDLAERLKTKSIAAIAREVGVPRTTLNDAVRRLRQRFEQSGLREYVANRPSDQAPAG